MQHTYNDLLAKSLVRGERVFLTRIRNQPDNAPTIYTDVDINGVDNNLSSTGNEDENDKLSESYPLFISASMRKYFA